ncbi:MAG: prenyltransferase [Spirochaetes bacterium]|nr:prenyltransferase [Spirochaetota bacterium]
MNKREMIKIWIAQVRGNFLLLAVLLVLLGLALAGLHFRQSDAGMFGLDVKGFSVIDALLLVAGVVIAHASVNLFNEYSDSKTGIDDNTMKTPFSGGTGLIQSGATTPLGVSTAAWTAVFWAFLIGLYFMVMSHWVIGVIVLIGGISIVFYTTHFAKVLMGEFFAGLSLGSLVVIGSYVAMVASPGDPACALFPANVVLIAIPPGILTALLLFLNEFPDREADRQGGRFHLVILLGRRKSSYLYVAGLAMTYLSILIVPLLGYSSWWLLLGFLTLPVAVKAGTTVLAHYDNMEKLVPALGMNVIVVLATDFLLAVGVFIGMIRL